MTIIPAWDDLSRDAILLVIAAMEGDDDGCEAIVDQYEDSEEALAMLAYELAKFAVSGFTEAARLAFGIWPGDEVPAEAVSELLRRYLRATL